MLSTLPWRRSKDRSAERRESAPKRRDIQGLRAVAVVVVLLYHSGAEWLPGGFVGVDVFFVISGFLITGGIVRELRRDGRISIKGFYVRRVARILPAATAAIAAVLAMTYLLLPQSRWAQIGADALGSSLYYVNWLFASSSLDYLARDQEPSPFQHFWSLAVEEQFYLFWPALLVFVTLLSLKLNFRLQKGLLIAAAAVAVPSLAWSIFYTGTTPGAAYFTTTTRIWELAIGAVFAIAAGRGFRAPAPVSAALGWTGLAAILYSAVTFNGAIPFPSYTALLPTIGAALTIWAGPTAGKYGPVLVLGVKPMVKIGELSYSLYLWHWPLIVISGAMLGTLSPAIGLCVVAVSAVPAWLSLRFIEGPAQAAILARHDDLSPLGTGVIMTLAGAAMSTIMLVSVAPAPPAATVNFKPQTATGIESKPVGAEVLAKGGALTIEDKFPAILPAAVNAKDDVPLVNRNGCMLNAEETEAKVCSFGDLSAKKSVALVGDSHAAMMVPAFDEWGIAEKVRVDTYTKGACPFVSGAVENSGKAYTACTKWVQNVTKQVIDTKPQAVISTMSRYRVIDGAVLSFEESKQPLASMLAQALKPIHDAGVKTVVLRDSPRPEVNIPDCVSKNESSLSKCALPQTDVLWADGSDVRAAENSTTIELVDLTSAFCTERCPAVIEGILVYRDNNHLTATYARTLHQQLGNGLMPFMTN